jgi:hypothetical protein
LPEGGILRRAGDSFFHLTLILSFAKLRGLVVLRRRSHLVDPFVAEEGTGSSNIEVFT